jgi:hypothetical protein
MKIVNLTPHVLNIVCKRTTLAIEPSGKIARLKEKVLKTLPPVIVTTGWGEANHHEIDVIAKSMEQIIDLPQPEDGVIYVASALVAAEAANAGRVDVLCPGTLVRDDKGVVVGCLGLVRPAVESPVAC